MTPGRVDGLDVDGALGEPVYREVPGASFITQEPMEGLPASEKTEVWLLFDDDNFYLGVRCWNSAPESAWIVKDMRRDSRNVISGEYVGVLIDTFHDRWNPVWELRTGRFAGGWTIEAAFPFKSLRYRRGRDQVRGFNLMRNVQ